MSTTDSPQVPRVQAARPPVPTTQEPGPISDEPTYRIPVVARPGASPPAKAAHWSQRAVRRSNPLERPNPSLAGDLAALAFDPPSQVLRAIPAQRTPNATEPAT